MAYSNKNHQLCQFLNFEHIKNYKTRGFFFPRTFNKTGDS